MISEVGKGTNDTGRYVLPSFVLGYLLMLFTTSLNLLNIRHTRVRANATKLNKAVLRYNLQCRIVDYT